MKVKQNEVYETKNYGQIKIININSWNDIDVEFISTGYKTKTSSSSILNGCVRDRMLPSVHGVGYLGDGPYKACTGKNKKMTEAYGYWSRMLRRCYDESSLIKSPTYKGCTVCEEWHNFQNFAKWHYENHPQDGKKYELDKDLSCYGMRGKLYSPATCIYVTKQINNEEANAKVYKFKNPSGDIVQIYNLKKFSRENGLHSGHMVSVHGGSRKSHKGWTAAL